MSHNVSFGIRIVPKTKQKSHMRTWHAVLAGCAAFAGGAIAGFVASRFVPAKKKKVRKRGTGPIIITIDGLIGAGKTTLLKRLEKSLGK